MLIAFALTTFSLILFTLPYYLVAHASHEEITGNATMTMTIGNQTISAFHAGYVSGKYVNPEAGLEVTFPEGWNGTQNKNEFGATQATVFAENLLQGTTIEESRPYIGLLISPINSSINERFGLQGPEYFASYNSSDTNPSDPANMPIECKRTSFEDIQVSGYPAMRLELQCPFLFAPSILVKTTFVVFETENSEIIFMYSTPSASNYEKFISEFDKVINSVNIKN